jgi:hypothetical protein
LSFPPFGRRRFEWPVPDRHTNGLLNLSRPIE